METTQEMKIDEDGQQNFEGSEAVVDVAVEDDEIVDETPEFLRPGDDAVEVLVDDENVPMDDDDDDGDVLDEAEMEEAPAVPDMSKAKLESHSGPVYAVATFVDPVTNAMSIVSGGGDDRAFLHRVVSGGTTVETKALEYAHTDSVSCVAFNMPYITEDLIKTPKLAGVGGYDGAILLYDPDTGTKVKSFEGPTDVEWLCFHPKGGTVLMVGSAADGTIWMFHIPLNKCLQVFVGHESAVTAGSFTPDGKLAVSCSSDGTVRIWAPRTGVSKHVFRLGGEGAGLTCMDVNGGSDGQLIITGAEDGQAHVCHVGNKKVVASLRHYQVPKNNDNTRQDDDEALELPMSVEAVGFAPQSVHAGWCATGGVDGVLKIWDLTNNGQCRQSCRSTQQQQQQGQQSAAALGGITRLKWHPSLPLVFCCYTTGFIHVWDARNGQLIHTMTGHTDVINDMDVQFSNNGQKALIVSASDDKTVRVFELDVTTLLQQSAAQKIIP